MTKPRFSTEETQAIRRNANRLRSIDPDPMSMQDTIRILEGWVLSMGDRKPKNVINRLNHMTPAGLHQARMFL